MALTYVKPTEKPYMNVLLYGPPKTGKTTGAASAPPGVLYINCDLPNATRLAHRLHPEMAEARFEGMQTIIDVQAIAAAQAAKPQGERKLQTVVIDPIGEMHRRLLEETSKGAIRPQIQDYGDVTVYIERFCRALCEMDVNVVLVAHETTSKDESNGTHERLPWTGTSNAALGAKLMAMVDIIGYTTVVDQEGGGKAHVAQLTHGGGQRGGDRFTVLGAERALDLSEWHALASADAKPDPEPAETPAPDPTTTNNTPAEPAGK
jgi:hypothetical protein